MAPTPIGQKPVTADQLRSVREGDGITAAPVAVSVGAARTTRRDHQHMLATKWMKASDLNDMVTREGLIYKKGKFSAIEDAQLRVAKENYRLRHSLTNEEVDELIFSKDKKRDVGFWQELTMAVPQRPLNAVYHHVRRITHPLKKMGKWMPEEDVRLTQAVMQHGPQWEIVSMQVGRMASDCRDRWRNHLMEKDKRKMGKSPCSSCQWSKDEEEELKRIVTELAQLQGKSVEESDTDVFWTKVSERMDYKRSRQQCRGKWTDVLSKTVKTTDPTRRWSQQDAYILIRKVDSLNIRHDTEIDWKTLIDPSWNLFSAHSLQRRWGTMKKSIKGWEQMTHAEIMDILRQKKGQPPPPSRRQERRKITSAAIINDDEDVVDDMSPTPDRAVGSSTGPGTLAGQHAQYEQDVVTTTTAEVPSARPATVAKKSPKPKLKPKKKLASATPSLVIKDYRTSAVAAPPEVLDSSSDESDSDD
ncbi:hypothetical protein PUNSTDRAFT_65638 [Punctularia strigosozonata HHB-11173 SS5]|uniref:uncharacterized protein n=1 Tax=Punctularia strigosozonata (strain HHB-11173) TaxID=741275 RepID=UPI00044186CF|nr:uncharacterized protein PUNSTDRAFT_65638 [Punctularia strigosozonata HHB-11173 SS5]EIN10900.1 hypothetical protein PUNSTDRAFT_65638 [Punctularia strigosozonata HHB-11173 SS5]